MSERLPPAIAIFFSETMRRRVMPRLGKQVASLRYDSATTIKAAFVEELSQAMSAAAERLRPDIAPALSIVLIADPARPAAGFVEIADLIRKACPPNVAFVLQWIGVYRPAEFTGCEGVAFLLSTTWRGGLIQGGSLDRAYQSLVLSVLATETSRVGFDSFTQLRFDSPGKVYKVAVDPIDLPDFKLDAETALRLAAAGNYFPEISRCAREAALRAAASIEPGPSLNQAGSRAAVEPAVAEPLLCAAFARSSGIAQAAAMLGDWAASASEATSAILCDLQVALTHWAADTGSLDYSKADPRLAHALFTSQGFPLLHELKMRVTATRSYNEFRRQTAIVRAGLIDQKRAELDRDYYDLMPGDLNSSQRLAIASNLAKANGAAARLTVTRHFPSGLERDMREEILDLQGLSTVLYAMEMWPE